MPQLWSCSFTPVSALTSQLNTREGRTLCQGSCRTFFQPLTTSRSFSISARNRGISCGSSCRSASSVITSSPRAWAKPALRAAALPKLRRNRRPRDPRVGGRQPADHLPRAVGRAVVDEHHVQVVALGGGHLGQLPVQSRQAFGFVEDGDDDGEHGQVMDGSGRIIGGIAKYRIPDITNSDTSHARRKRIAATRATRPPQIWDHHFGQHGLADHGPPRHKRHKPGHRRQGHRGRVQVELLEGVCAAGSQTPAARPNSSIQV